jgi:hypothetical protein
MLDLRRRKDLLASLIVNEYTDDDTQCRYGFIQVNYFVTFSRRALLKGSYQRVCFITFCLSIQVLEPHTGKDCAYVIPYLSHVGSLNYSQVVSLW